MKETFTEAKEDDDGSRRFNPERISHMSQEAEIIVTGGKTTGEVCRRLRVSEQSYYRWRNEHSGMQLSRTRNLKGPVA